MKLRYIYTLLSLVTLLYFVPATAQTKHKAKKHTSKASTHQKSKKQAKKPAKKLTPKKSAKTATALSKQKTEAKNLGDAVAKAAVDTTKGSEKTSPKNNNALSEEIVVTTAYKPVLADAVKIRRNPDLDDKTPFKAPLTYKPLDVRLELNSDIRQLDAMKMPPERDSIPQNNYVKGGVGNLKTTYGELYVDNGPDQALQTGLFVKHFANQGTLEKQNESKDEIGVFGKSVGAVNSLSGRIGYKYNSNYFYGFDPANQTVPVYPAHQHFSIISGEGELAKNFVDSANVFTYALKLQGYKFSNAFLAKEGNITLSGFVNQTVKQFYSGLAGSLDLNSQKDSLYAFNNSLVRLNPYIKLQGDNYKIDAGVNIVDNFGSFTGFYIFPAAKLEVQVIPKYVRLFVEAKGDVNKSTLLGFSELNPFIGQNIKIKNSIDQLDVSAGLKGTIAPGLGFKVFIFRNSVKYLPLIVSDFGAQGKGNRFAVVYDNGKSRINGFTGEIDYKASDDVNVFGMIEYKQYQLATEAEPWNLPKFKLIGGTILHINNKVDITGTLLFRGSTYDRVNQLQTNRAVAVPIYVLTPVTISSFADLSGGVDYKATNKFTVFVKVNNILSTTNQTWLYYPDYGFNIFGGVGFAF
jgi:hypothetical protein